jgi:hypothetical protein
LRKSKIVLNKRLDDYFTYGISLLAYSIKAGTIIGINDRTAGRMLEKIFLAGCSKASRYKAPRRSKEC